MTQLINYETDALPTELVKPLLIAVNPHGIHILGIYAVIIMWTIDFGVASYFLNTDINIEPDIIHFAEYGSENGRFPEICFGLGDYKTEN